MNRSGNLWSAVILGPFRHAAVTTSAATVDGGWTRWCVKKAGSLAR